MLCRKCPTQGNTVVVSAQLICTVLALIRLRVAQSTNSVIDPIKFSNLQVVSRSILRSVVFKPLGFVWLNSGLGEEKINLSMILTALVFYL